MAIDEWLADYDRVSANANALEWFVSPLEYHWSDGKRIFDAMFRSGGSPNPNFDEMVSPDLFRSSMQVDFRAKMMVFAFMRQSISGSFGVEIENGLLALYRLDFFECLSQWVYVVEGYCRKLFSVQSLSNVKSSSWSIASIGDVSRDRIIASIRNALSSYLDGILFASGNDLNIQRLSRHLLFHGNVQNKKFFSQKNCLIVMFILDALVTIEMVKSSAFPAIFDEEGDEHARIQRRKQLYSKQLEYTFSDQNLLKIQVLGEHA